MDQRSESPEDDSPKRYISAEPESPPHKRRVRSPDQNVAGNEHKRQRMDSDDVNGGHVPEQSGSEVNRQYGGLPDNLLKTKQVSILSFYIITNFTVSIFKILFVYFFVLYKEYLLVYNLCNYHFNVSEIVHI